MPSFASTFSLVALLGRALAVPMTSPAGHNLFARQYEPGNCETGPYQGTDWCSTNPDDKVILQVTDKKVPWGELVAGDVVNAVRAQCSSGKCPSSSITLQTNYIVDQRLAQGTLRIFTEESSVPPIEMESMLDAILRVLDNGGVVDVEDKTYVVPVVCPIGPCNPTERTSTQRMGPAEISLAVKQPAEGVPLISRGIAFYVSIETQFETDAGASAGGACGALSGAIGTVLGLINPILSVSGPVGAIACGTLPA